jgi:hypothetical protein
MRRSATITLAIGFALLALCTPVYAADTPADPAPKLELAGTFARLGMFFMTMMLMSLAAEKVADLVKMVLMVFKLRPKPRLGAYLGKDQTLVGLDKDRLVIVHRLMLGRPAVNRDDEGTIREEVQREDTERDRREALWTTGMRFLAALAGTGLCHALKIDAFAYVAPLGIVLEPRVGMTLTGFGASAGAAFWQDLFDRMTDSKRKIA